MRIGAGEHGGLLIELPTRADAARHRGHQVGQLDALHVRGMQPACGQLGNQRFDATFSYLGNVDQAPRAPRRMIGYRGRIHQYQTLEALQLSSNDLEGEIAAKRETNQGKARRHVREQLLGHPSQRIVFAKSKYAALIVSLDRGNLRSV
jgi:hypothetical protein